MSIDKVQCRPASAASKARVIWVGDKRGAHGFGARFLELALGDGIHDQARAATPQEAIANGADNIAVYTPVFRTLGAPQTIVTIAVFLICVGLWCAAGRMLGTHKKVIDTLERVEHWLVPTVFIGLGVIILLESGVIGRLIAAAA